MFETRIQNTKLAGSLADCMFRRINGCDYEGDVSFISTLRVMLMNRVTGDDRIEFKTYAVDLLDDPQAMTKCLESYLRPNTIVYLNVTRDIASDDESAKQKFCAFPAPDVLRELCDVREFFAQKMVCRAFINEHSRSAVVAVLDSNLKKHHLVQCIVPKLLPWFFDQGRISVAERNLLYALRERLPGAYTQAVDAMCDTEDFRQMSASAAVMVFKRKSLERQKQTTERTIANYNDTIERLNRDLLSALRSVNQENFKLNGILLALQSDVQEQDELMQFMANNRSVSFVDSDSDDMKLLITGYLDVYDPEAYRSMARNTNCWYWTESATISGPFMQRENRKLVMDAIFGDNPVFKVKTYGLYSLNIERGEVSVRGRYDSAQCVENRYPNPHLYYASCLGTYRQYINKALQCGDIVGAISQCIASVHSVNVTESATFRHLCRDIFARSNEAILEGPNGQSFTTLQAYEYLRAQQNQTTQGE